MGIGKTLSKSITLTHAQWEKLRERLKQDYPPSVILIREKMKQVLGFVDREYAVWMEDSYSKTSDVRLDFYNEPKRTMFLLKYSEYLDKSGKIDS